MQNHITNLSLSLFWIHFTFDKSVFLSLKFIHSKNNFPKNFHYEPLLFVCLLREKKQIFPIRITWRQKSFCPLYREENILVHCLFANRNVHQCISLTVRYVDLSNHLSRFFFLFLKILKSVEFILCQKLHVLSNSCYVFPFRPPLPLFRSRALKLFLLFIVWLWRIMFSIKFGNSL